MGCNLKEKLVERKTKTVYKDGDKVVKLFVENYSKADILNEALNQERVLECASLNVPRLVEITNVGNKWAIVSEYAEGKTLSTLIKEYPEKFDEYMKLLVKIQLDILSNKVPLLNRIKDKYKRKLTNLKGIDENTRYELLQRLEGMKNHDKLCHGDFNPSNIIIDEKGNYHIIDWAHATQGNASADAARTYLLFALKNEIAIADKYLNIFSEMSGISKENVQRWIPIVAAVQLEKCTEEEAELLKKWINIIDFQ